MSNVTLSYLNYVSQEIVIYISLFLFITGLVGGTLVLVVFLSLRTFRESSCAFYLTVMSAANILQSITGPLTYAMKNGFQIDLTAMSLAYCKILYFVYQFCLATSFTCMCLAIIDQYLATCSNPRWHRFNNIKTARYIVFCMVIIYLLHGIPYLFYYDNIFVVGTAKWTCTITNQGFFLYFRTFFLSIYVTGLPLLIIIFFGILAYRNVQQIAYRAVPLVRRELDKQMTIIVLIQACCDVFFVVPYLSFMIFNLITGTSNDSIRLIQILTTLLYNFHFSNSFYIYVCISKRFRQQFIYVLYLRCFNRRPVGRENTNVVRPHT